MAHGAVNLRTAAGLLSDAGDIADYSTLSRYVAKHADVLRPQVGGRGRETLVDFELLAAHRAGNPQTARFRDDQADFAGSRSEEAAANARAQRKLRELDLAERQGDLIIRAEAETGATEAVAAMRNAFALALNDTAETLAAVTRVEPRLIRPHLRALEKQCLKIFAKVLSDYLMEGPSAGNAGQLAGGDGT